MLKQSGLAGIKSAAHKISMENAQTGLAIGYYSTGTRKNIDPSGDFE